MSNRKLETTFVLDFAVHHPTTGTLATPDTGPTVSVYEDLTNTPILTPTPAVRNAITGTYKVAVAATTANGFELGKSYNVVAYYGFTPGPSQAQILERFTLDGKFTSDLNDLAQAAILSDATPFAGGNIDAAVSTRAAPADLVNLDAAVSTRAVESTVAKEATVNGVPAATSAAVTSAHGAGPYNTVAPTVGEIDTELTTAHGAGSWQTGAGGDPGVIADYVWEELLSGHTADGSTGKALAYLDAAITSRPTAAQTEAEIAAHHGTGAYDAVGSTASADAAKIEAEKARKLAQKILKKVK